MASSSSDAKSDDSFEEKLAREIEEENMESGIFDEGS